MPTSSHVIGCELVAGAHRSGGIRGVTIPRVARPDGTSDLPGRRENGWPRWRPDPSGMSRGSGSSSFLTLADDPCRLVLLRDERETVADEAPEPDPTHGAFEVGVEGCIHQHR
jgi:hypothetical protein